MLSYSRKVALTDAGAFVSQLILHLPEIVAAGTVTPETFSVFVKRSNRTTGEAIHLARRNFSPEALKDAQDGLSQGYWKIRSVSPCDDQGRPMDRSDHVALEMEYGPLVL